MWTVTERWDGIGNWRAAAVEVLRSVMTSDGRMLYEWPDGFRR